MSTAFDEIILATGNSGKIAELQSLLPEIHCIPQHRLNIPNADETGLSFIENAIIKARHASKLGKKAALADDSGLVVEALGGEPGIYSARYAGHTATDEKNIKLLLSRMKHLIDTQRSAYFYCAIALVRHVSDPTPFIATGHCFGNISQEPKGDMGFGYDPIFYLNDYKCTMAQISSEIKNNISHRSKALQQLRRLIDRPFYEI